MVETINKLIRVQRQLLQDLGREPSPEEIGEEMELTADRVREILKISQEPVSLETPIGEEDDSHLGDFIEDSEAQSPSDHAAYELLKEQLEDVLDTLTDREEMFYVFVLDLMMEEREHLKKLGVFSALHVSVFVKLRQKHCAK